MLPFEKEWVREWKLVSQDTPCITKIFSFDSVVSSGFDWPLRDVEGVGFRAAVIAGAP